MNNILLIDKPAGWTSFDVVAKIRNACKSRQAKTTFSHSQECENVSEARLRVGHAGTLDPFATGLLIVLVGDVTKKQADFMKLDKEYEATLRLGYTSSTGDPEGEIIPHSHSEFISESQKILKQVQDDKGKMPNKSQISNTIKKFVGETEQIPPKYSAIKVKGKRAYELARKGEDFKLKPRTIILYSIEVLGYHYPELKIKVKCSSGTYIRTLAEDIGKALGTGAYLTALRRTKIGDYNIEHASTIDKIVKTC